MRWTRRQFVVAAGAGLAGAANAPKLAVIFVESVPERGGWHFTRAYAACPEPAALRASIASGMFPHSRSQGRALTILDAEAQGVPTLFVTRPEGDSPFERSVRLKMTLRHPRAASNVSDVPFSTVDVAPTMFGLSGIAAPEGVQGRDLSALLLTGAGERPESVYLEGGLSTADEWRAVVRGFDKLVVRPNLEVLHLFNLAEDPAESRDLALEPGHQLRVDELKALVRVWMRRTADGQDPSGLRRR